MQEIDELVAFEGRGPGSDAERRAAGHLAARLREMGREAEIESIRVHPRYALVHLVFALLAIVGSVLSITQPLAGAILVLLAAVSATLDLTGALLLDRRLTGSRASQNVVSREDGGKPGTLILTAHYDAGRSGALLGGALAERRAAVGKAIRRPIGPFEPYLWSLIALLVCCVIRLVGIEGYVLTILQFVPTVVLILNVPLVAGIALGEVTPGAAANASGVATVLRLAERYGGDLDHFDLWVLLPGASDGVPLGMREWMKRHRKQLDRARTIFVNVDRAATGTVRYATKEGNVVAHSYHPTLVKLCDQIADEDEEEKRYRARPVASRTSTDATAARTRGFPAISISCLNALDYEPHEHRASDLPENVDEEALERAFGFCSELIELIDERVGEDLAAAGDGEATELTEADG